MHGQLTGKKPSRLPIKLNKQTNIIILQYKLLLFHNTNYYYFTIQIIIISQYKLLLFYNTNYYYSQ